jgi:putative inorganic carbon (HCO3(-)) transporter
MGWLSPLITSERASSIPFNKSSRLMWGAAAALSGLGAALLPPTAAFLGIGTLLLASLSLYQPFALFAALLVLAPLRTLIQTESPIQLPLDIGQILLIAFVGLWCLHRRLHRRPILTLSLTLPALPLGLFVAWGVLSWLWAVSLSAAITESLKWFMILIVAMFVHYHASGGRWRMFVFALVIAAAANAVVGIYIFFGGSGADHLAINNRFFRAFGTFGQPNPFGGFMGLILPLSLMMVWDYGRLWLQQRRAAYGLLALTGAVGSGLIGTALIMSWSRGAWLSAAASIFVVVILLPRRTWQSAALFFLLIGSGLVIWSADLLPTAITQRIASSTEEFFAFDDMRGVDITVDNYAVVERLAHWQAALNMAEAHPLGVGLGGFNAAYERYRLLNWPQALGHAHNYYLNVLAETGIIGLVLFLIFQGTTLLMALRGRSHISPSVKFLSAALVGAWVYLAFHSLLDNLYVNNVFLHVGVLLGLTFWVYRQSVLGTTTEYHGNSATFR